MIKMSSEPTLCVVCAWRENCKKKFLKGNDVSLRCPDFAKDLSIKQSEKNNDKKEDIGDCKGGV